jgi:alpha-L-fucosidase
LYFYDFILLFMKTLMIGRAASIIGLTLLSACSPDPKIHFEENWESLSRHEAAPEWFRDAKLGIYFHWGVYSVPAYGSEWYPRNMHYLESPEGKHHLEKYGHPSEFGYHDFVPMFTAEHFDAEEWAELFRKAGARFAGPVAEHHDGFSMWDSDVTPWNAMDMGPKRDITGELARALRKKDMKLITTFHHARNLQRHQAGEDGRSYENSHYPFFEGMPPSSDDPELSLLYGNIPEDIWLEKIWYGKLKEVVDKYRPDIVWFDAWLDEIPEAYRQKFCAYYLNAAESWDKEVVIVRKQDDLPLNFTVDDLEKSRKNELDEQPWMTDETISYGSWGYTEGLEIKPARDIIHVLADITSKNGVLLLNISPKSDGTIPDDQREVLLALGAWLSVFGEAIYETRPWYTFGEGPTREPEGNFANHRQFERLTYTSRDIRYTTRGDTVYAIQFGSQEPGSRLVLEAFGGDSLSVREVSAVATGREIPWVLEESGLVLTLPEGQDENANIYRIIL